MKKVFLSVILLFYLQTINASNVEIVVKVSQSFAPQAKLYLFYGNEVQLVDSSWQNEPGTYRFKLHDGYTQGMYRVDVGQNIKINFIVSNEPVIDISTVVYAPQDSLKSINSLENFVFWQYQNRKQSNAQHTWLIRSLMDYYSDTSLIHSQLKLELENQTQAMYDFGKQLAKNHGNLLAAKYISIDQRPVLSSKYKGYQRIEMLKEAWWRDIDLKNSLIIHSPAIQSRIWSYIELLFSEEFDKEEQDEAFIAGVEKLMNKNMHQSVQLFFRDVLINGFKNSDYLPVLEFLETSSFGSLKPLREPKKETRRSKHLPRINVGEKAFDFYVCLPDGKRIKLSKIDADYKLVVFWSTWCPHCIESLPRIMDIYENYKDKGFEVIAVSIDDEDDIWRKYINDLGLSWINIRETISRESELLYMYEVEETPKMFLLSRDLTIESRPSTRRQLEVRLRRIFR